MCGFIGCFNDGGRPLPRGVLEGMLSAIRHRGPDDEGLHGVSFARGSARPLHAGDEGGADCDGGFAFARLSIQDLSQAGHQPMASANGDVVLVFNGEIYNASEHRQALLTQGVSFRGHSDTEVILRLYERLGWDDMLARLDGMFALAIVDLRTRQLHLARDHFGIKPLYWWQDNGTLLLASEIKAFLRHPGFAAQLESSNLAEQFMFRYTAWDRTLLRGVKQLPPGHTLSWRPGEPAKVARYWALPDAASGDEQQSNHVVDEALSLLETAVRSQMVSDVPVGTQLSGGIDSSLVTLAAAADTPDPLEAFSIIFDDPCISEDQWIGEAARVAKVRSNRYLFAAPDFAADFDRVTWHLDGPPGNPNTLAIHLLASHAKHRVKVLLTGEGCDELFGGYNRFYYMAMQQRHPGLFRAGAALGARTKGRLWRLFGQAAQTLDHQLITGSAYGAAGLTDRLLPWSKPEEALTHRLDHLAAIPGSPLARQVRYEAETYLPDLLLRQDKMTMAQGVECRVPFLDLKLAGLARRLPESWLVVPTYGANARMRGTKRLLKEMASRRFGKAFAFRRKRGFDVPLASFFTQKACAERMQDDWLPAIRRRGIVAPGVAETLWQDVLQQPDRQKGAAEALWVAVGLEVWARQFLGS